MAELAEEFEEAAGISLQNLEDRQVWLVQGYLITVAECNLSSVTPESCPELKPSSNRRDKLMKMLVYIGLALLLAAFGFVFVGTLIFMGTIHR